MEGLYCEVTLFQMIPELALLREPFAVKCCVVLLLHCTFVLPWCYRVTLSSAFRRRAQCSEEVPQGAPARAGLSRALQSPPFRAMAGWCVAVPWAYGTLPSILLCFFLLPKPPQCAPSSREVLQNLFLHHGASLRRGTVSPLPGSHPTEL